MKTLSLLLVSFILGLRSISRGVSAFTTICTKAVLVGPPTKPFAGLNKVVLIRRQSTQLQALLDPSSLPTIHDAFSAATFLPQPFWLLLVLLPNSSITKKVMGGMEIVTLCCLVHFFIVSASLFQPDATAPLAEFAGVFDPAGDPQKAFIGMMQYPNFVSEEWSHVLTWDLFAGRWIWLDGLRRGIFTPHSVLLCNFIGPPGLLLHWATCIITGKGIVGNEAEDMTDLDDE